MATDVMAGSGVDGAALGAGLWISAVVVATVLLATFAIAVLRGKHSVIDAAWGIAFSAVALAVYATSSGYGDPGRRLLLLLLTGVWGLRLAVHIGARAWGAGEDPRYTELLARAPGSATWYAVRMVYVTQGAVVWFVSLPIVVGMYERGGLGPAAAVGGAVWFAGLGFEAVGDRQLARFKREPANRGRLMESGLWRYTRHPNYFGDACVWWGLYLVACDSWPGALTAASPVLMTYVLVAGTGKAMTERRMADRPGYAEYVARTSGFLPRPPRRGLR